MKKTFLLLLTVFLGFSSSGYSQHLFQAVLRTFEISCNDPNVIFAADNNNGLYKTNNNGATWHNILSKSIQSLSINDNNPNLIYAAEGG